MKRYIEDRNFIIEDQKDFILSQTLECGQCFHFIKLDEEDYLISAKDRILHIAQEGNRTIFYNTDEQTFDNVWKHYFDLERDYGKIKTTLIEKDERLTTAIEAMSGVRILNQDFFETLISFIISQNQQIVRIKQIIANISSRYGKKGEGIDYFPKAPEILAAGEQGMMDCKAGFRAKYILSAAKKCSNEIDLDRLHTLPIDEARNVLMTITGVGPKVADCTLLFGLGFHNAFPMDVWMKRAMVILFDNKLPDGLEDCAGVIQQYIFHYARTEKITFDDNK